MRGAILAFPGHPIRPIFPPVPKDITAMDASQYFRLTDRIDGAASREELAAIEAEIERTQPHVIERRALERRMHRRERALESHPSL
jgi:hypothetical protein